MNQVNKKIISFAIPVFNNEGSLLKTYEKINSLFKIHLIDYNFEIIFTNDGSKDNSLDELKLIREKDNRVKIIDFSRNFGQVAATIASTRKSTGDAVVIVSADMQDPIFLVKEMIKEWENKEEIIICFRESRQDSFLNKLTSKIYFSMVQLHVKEEIPKGGFDFCLLDRNAVDSLNNINDKIRGLHYDILSLGFKKKYIPYKRLKREIGVSQYNFIMRLRDFTNAFISISFIPIRLIILIGFLISFTGIIYSISIFFSWLNGSTPFEGWAPIMVIILIIGGIIMIMLGIIGEYIWRIYEESKKRPNYIIRKIYDKQ